MLTWFTQLSGPLQWAVGAGTIIIALGILWAGITLLFLPLLALIQRLLSPVENSTSISDNDYLTGTLTLPVATDHTGEVMITGGGRARQTYPAKLWAADAPALTQGEQVVVVELRQGVAYVERLRTALTSDSH
ncbi:MAG: hypothetical protein LKJ69_08045 [Lactobacillus sp.]|jgi:membrane protein implicated in regulation of membrane protease activity|nr:hypothetical protein [Lactobacillus sp.]MCI2033343.1 hypothetical protein [Lactobacillus sp.]